ncbi:MAG: homogentisate 1,2-dioxygenase [Pseudomonadota bacterium]
MAKSPTAVAMLDYMPGFGNDFETESLPGALPQGRNSPKRCPYGLYAEQLSGSPFTAPQATLERSWMYRIRPSVKHVGRFAKIDMPYWKSAPNKVKDVISLGQYRWDPTPFPSEPVHFITGMRSMTTAGDVNTHIGMASHVYLANQDMNDEYFYNADAELLIVPQHGGLMISTEFGRMTVAPLEICVLPRGMLFKVDLMSDKARGFVCENYGAKFKLPGRGPIGANCLANPRDFKTPVAWYEDRDADCTVTVKWCGEFHTSSIDHSPLDVVAWHGNYAPYKYDLRTFAAVGSITFDHPDPSIFTVLTAPTAEEGTANIDFVIFPPRWLPQENTFRPPWYHKNIMSELMGNVYGEYDAKPSGFAPGGISLHNCMLPHGPDNEAFLRASFSSDDPVYLDHTLSFMFETRFPQMVTQFAANEAPLQDDYVNCWDGLEKRFDGTLDGRWPDSEQ